MDAKPNRPSTRNAETLVGVTTCPEWEEVSAALDGEISTVASHAALQHAARCPTCRTALDTVVAPLAKVATAAMPPRFDTELATASERRWLTGRWTRWLLLAAAVVIVAEAVPTYIQGDGLDSQTHAARHLAAWQIGFGVGLLVASWVSRMSHAMLALASTFAILSAAATTINLLAGHSGPLAETVHLIELIGVFLLWRITPPHLRAWRQVRSSSKLDRNQPEPTTSTLSLVRPTSPDPTANK